MSRAFWALAQGESDAPATLRIDGSIVADDDAWYYDWISESYVCPSGFRRALEGVGDLVVAINSPGGDVVAASCIYTALREHAARGHQVQVRIEGMAASAASVIAMAGTSVAIAPTAYIMIHDPWSTVSGNPDELRDCAAMLDSIAEGIVSAYQLRTGMSRAHIRELMRAETWMDARRAVRLGFADTVLYAEGESEPEGEPAPASDRAGWTLRAVASLRAHAPAPHPVNPRADALLREQLRLLADDDMED